MKVHELVTKQTYHRRKVHVFSLFTTRILHCPSVFLANFDSLSQNLINKLCYHLPYDRQSLQYCHQTHKTRSYRHRQPCFRRPEVKLEFVFTKSMDYIEVKRLLARETETRTFQPIINNFVEHNSENSSHTTQVKFGSVRSAVALWWQLYGRFDRPLTL